MSPGKSARTPASPGPEFGRLVLGRRRVYLKRDILAQAQPILARLDAIRAGKGAGRGNRASAFPITVEGAGELVVRLSRRGGLVRLLLDDLYLGLTPRPVRELAVAAEAMRRGIPVAEPMGVLVEWVWPGVYRGAMLTRALAGMTLWEFLRTDDERRVREHVLGLARQAVDTMHERGLVHADLNLNNLFVATSGEHFAVAILDLDKAHLLGGPVSAPARRRSFRRLVRSVLKLDPEGRYLDAAERERLTAH